VRPDGIVLPAPLLDENLGFLERIEDLPIDQLALQLWDKKWKNYNGTGPPVTSVAVGSTLDRKIES